MSDLISRQAALNQITAIDTSIIPYARAREYVDELKSYVIKIIEDLPSAEPDRKWIPFEVALPNNRQKVLCLNKHDEMMVGGYMSDYGMTFPCYFEKPIAWMPLPEPYRGE